MSQPSTAHLIGEPSRASWQFPAVIDAAYSYTGRYTGYPWRRVRAERASIAASRADERAALTRRHGLAVVPPGPITGYPQRIFGWQACNVHAGDAYRPPRHAAPGRYPITTGSEHYARRADAHQRARILRDAADRTHIARRQSRAVGRGPGTYGPAAAAYWDAAARQESIGNGEV